MKIPKKYIHQSGYHKGKIKQKLIQTGKPRSYFKLGSPHPFVKGLFYINYDTRYNKESWGTLETLEKNKAVIKKWYIKNKERHRSVGKKWMEQNKDRFKVYQKNWCKDNTNKLSEYKKQWVADNIERVRIINKTSESKRRAIKSESVKDLTKTQEIMIKHYYAHASRVSSKLGIEFHVDHIVPLSLGGLHHPSNLQVVPARWNMRKHNNNTNLWLPNGL